MRKISVVFVVLVALATLPLTAERRQTDLGERVRGARIVRIIKKMFGVRTNSDGLMPPVPVTPPRP